MKNQEKKPKPWTPEVALRPSSVLLKDLSVIVAEIDNDDDVVLHASVTQQRGSGSKTRISCSHAHERTNRCPPSQGFEKKEATQTDAESKKNSGDKTDRATMRSTTHTSKHVCMQTNKGKGHNC